MADQEAKLKEVSSRVDASVDGIAKEMGVEAPEKPKPKPAAAAKAAPPKRPESAIDPVKKAKL